MYSSTLFLTIAAFTVLRSNGQITSDTSCPDLSALDNSRGQTPCLVAAFLGGMCNNGQWDVGSVGNGTYYIGPSGDIVNECTCSSVYYSLIGGCSACQSANIISWSDWKQNCTSNVTNVGLFPPGIPADTVVPGWAFEDVTKNNTFSTSSALADNSPESSAVTNAASSTSSSSTSATKSITASVAHSTQTSSASTSPTASSSSGSTSHAGAIAGGVVGGIVGIAGLSAFAFFLGRRHKKESDGAAGGSTSDWPGAPMMSESASTRYTPPNSAAHMYDPVKLYDPNDPSTFPSSPPPGSFGSQPGSYGNPQENSLPHLLSAHNTGPQGSYRGVPEV